MTKDHYDYIVAQFGLTDQQTWWHKDYTRITSAELTIGFNTRSYLAYIYCESLEYDLASHLDSVQLAEEIIRSIKETELLFV